MASTKSVLTISADQITDAVITSYKAKRALLLIGPPGIGKTAFVHEAGDHMTLVYKEKVHVRELHLASMSEVDVRGYLVPQGDYAKFTKPEFWADVEKYDRGILFLDEFPQAPHEVQKAVATLIYEGRIGEYTLKPGWAVVLAGNGLEDNAGANTLLSHIVNRLSIVQVRAPDPDEWVNWAIAKQLEPEAIAFAKLRPDVVFSGTIPTEPNVPYCTPRSLHAVSDMAKAYHPDGLRKMVSEPLGMAMLTGLVGQGAMAELVGLVNTTMNLPSYDDVVRDPLGTLVPEKADLAYTMVMLAGSRCRAEHAAQVGAYLCRFKPNFTITGLAALGRRGPEYVTGPAILQWVMANQHMMGKFAKYISAATR
jgi:hypothetical protein